MIVENPVNLLIYLLIVIIVIAVIIWVLRAFLPFMLIQMAHADMNINLNHYTDQKNILLMKLFDNPSLKFS